MSRRKDLLSRREMSGAIRARLRQSGACLDVPSGEALAGSQRPVASISRQRLRTLSPKAKAVIQLMQNGGPSQMDLCDPKPLLSKLNGKKHSEKLETLQEGSADNVLMGSPYKFEKRGQCGMDISELLPHTATIVDEITLIRSMYTEHNNHSEALVMLQTGKIFPGRPTTGSWISYALGTENQNLPAFVVLRDPEGYNTNGIARMG